MATKESKAQLAVWEAKERLSEELLKLPVKERIPYIIEKTRVTVEALKKKKALRKKA